MLVWTAFYLEECFCSAQKDIGKQMKNWYVVWILDCGGLWLKWTKAEDAIWIVKLLKKQCSFAVFMGFTLLLLILLLHLKFLAWCKMRVFSFLGMSGVQSVLDKEVDVASGCFWLGESGSCVAELSCWKQHDCLLEVFAPPPLCFCGLEKNTDTLIASVVFSTLPF